MKYTAIFALAALFTGSALAQEKVVLRGSDTLGAKMVPQLKAGYLGAGHKANIEITAEGSSSAFTNLLSGIANIGMSSRDANEAEKNRFIAKGQKLVEHVAAWDMIVVVVNEKNSVHQLTLAQIEGIFTGDIKNWAEVGGNPSKISVYTRNTASGTYKTFQKLAMSKRDYGSDAQKIPSGDPIGSEVSGNINGIGYVGLAYANKEGLAPITVNGITPKPKNKAIYPLSRKLYYYTVGEPTGKAKEFLDWCLNDPRAKMIVERIGFTPVD